MKGFLGFLMVTLVSFLEVLDFLVLGFNMVFWLDWCQAWFEAFVGSFRRVLKL